jgi:hypothetical protein
VLRLEEGLTRVRSSLTRPVRILAGAGALALIACGCAYADPVAVAGPGDDFSQHQAFTPQPNQIGPQGPHRTLQWDARKGRWGLSLDMSQPNGRDPDWHDARVGLNYRVAPGLRTGVGVSLGSETAPDTHQFVPQDPSPRVNLETTFKF